MAECKETGAGGWITASGEWINDRAHGQQFKARFLKTSLDEWVHLSGCRTSFDASKPTSRNRP
jgi:hypothetical protein